jgi:hypothetical protein
VKIGLDWSNGRPRRREVNITNLNLSPNPTTIITIFNVPRIDGNTAKMKVKIRKWNAVAIWRWDIPDDDVCGICQVHFDGTCPTCKYPGDDCILRKRSLLLFIAYSFQS